MTKKEQEHDSFMEKAVIKQVRILAVENKTKAKTHQAVEALENNNWDVEASCEIIRNRLKGEYKW